MARWSEIIKDPYFFDEERPGGVYYARFDNPYRHRVISKKEADFWRDEFPNPVDNTSEYYDRLEMGSPLAIWFVPEPYTRHKSDIKRSPGLVTPVFEIAQGELRADFIRE